ncbi:hypothetical protein [Christiangramia flava]|uniref:hypothetical protein n=1 Tax=Christiangramia flava TaxID=1486245 RepID=UPI00111BE329|nr:hypothetical protein [Christiangramia flava]
MKEPKPQANVTFVTFASVCNKYIAAVNWKNFIAAFLLMVYCGSYALAELQLPAIFSSSVVTVINPNCKKYQLQKSHKNQQQINEFSHFKFQDQLCHISFLLPQVPDLRVNKQVEKPIFEHLLKSYSFSNLPQPPPPRV